MGHVLHTTCVHVGDGACVLHYVTHWIVFCVVFARKPCNATQSMYIYTLSNSKTVCEVCIASCNVYELCLSYIVHNMYMKVIKQPNRWEHIISTNFNAKSLFKILKKVSTSSTPPTPPSPSGLLVV